MPVGRVGCVSGSDYKVKLKSASSNVFERSSHSDNKHRIKRNSI